MFAHNYGTTAQGLQAPPYESITTAPAGTPVPVQASTEGQVPVQAQVTSRADEPEETIGYVDRREMHYAKLYVFGVAEVILGSLAVILWAVTIGLAASTQYDCSVVCLPARYTFTYISTGLWAGAFLAVSGGIAIRTRRKPSERMYKVNLAMTVVSAVLMLALFAMSAAANALDSPAISVHFGLTAIGGAGWVVATLHSTYGCSGAFCRYGNPPLRRVYTYDPAATHQLYDHRPGHRVVYPFSRAAPVISTTIYYPPNQPVNIAPPAATAHPSSNTTCNPPPPSPNNAISTVSGVFSANAPQCMANQQGLSETADSSGKTEELVEYPAEPPEYDTVKL